MGLRAAPASRRPAKAGEHGSSAGLSANLTRLVELARGRGVEVVLMTYPDRRSFYFLASSVIRRLAELADTVLIDLARVFAPRCLERSCPELLLEDGHPNSAGYRLVAETLVEALSPRYGR